MYEITDSSGAKHRTAEIVWLEPETGLADFLVPIRDDGAILDETKVPARRVPHDDAGAPYTWRRVA